MESASRRYPSFSSTLLDEIYRSIDQEQESIPTKHRGTKSCFEDDEGRGACVVQEWIENKAASTACGSFCLNESVVYIKPKPIRTCVYQHDKHRSVYGQEDSQTKSKFTKTKSKALKILKHPISPGGRLATFLNSLFTNNNPNSRKSTCSSASRSRLTNITPSSTNGFTTHNNQENKLNVNDNDNNNNNNISEAARNLFKNYQNKVEQDSGDAGSSSDSSSDLFELSAHMYRDELPVYETTQLDTNPLFMYYLTSFSYKLFVSAFNGLLRV